MDTANGEWMPFEMGALVVQAGLRALKLQDGIQGTHKADMTLLTQADLETEVYLTHMLQKLQPGARVLGEESWDRTEFRIDDLRDPLYIIDPIDGTAVYASGLPGWGVSLGYAEAGLLRHGAIFLPGSGELYLTAGTQALYCRLPLDRIGHPILPAGHLAEQLAQLLEPLPFRKSQPVKLAAVTQYVAKGLPFAVPYTVVSTASFVVSLLNTARGSFAVYLAKAKIWDMAAAWPIARAVGVRARLVESAGDFDLPLESGPWIWDAGDPEYLGLHEHVIFYRDEEVARVCLQASKSWPSARRNGPL